MGRIFGRSGSEKRGENTVSNQPFQWCFLGTGTLAGHVAKEITASGRHQIRTVCSRRFEKAQEFADKWGAAAYADAAAAVSAEGVDGVYVVTPHNSHYALARLALELNKPVLCEKPFTVRGEDTRALFDLAAERSVYLAEGMWTWFAPVANKIKEWVDTGAIGEVQDVVTQFRVNVLNYAPRLTDPNLAGGALLDSGVYPITYLYRLFGKPTDVKCAGRIENGVDLSDEIDLTFENGHTFHISLAIDAAEPDLYIRIIGAEGEIRADGFHYTDKATLTRPDGSAEVFEGKTTMLNEFDLVAEEIRRGLKQSLYVPSQATIDVMEILDDCRKQIGLVYPFE